MTFLYAPATDSRDYIYDIETFPNVFTNTVYHPYSDQWYVFELSRRMNDLPQMLLFFQHLRTNGSRMVGFNNIGFDYPVIHHIIKSGNNTSVADIYRKVRKIIDSPREARFAHTVWENEWEVDQIDLYKVHHFDNMSRATSLKMLEFNMRMDRVEDLPFPLGIELNNEQIDVLLGYNKDDVIATTNFYHESADKLRFREELSDKHGSNFMNHNDAKIGSDIFIMRLEEAAPGACYKYVNGKRTMNQTKRESIQVRDIILPMVEFEHEAFQRIHAWFKAQVITDTKGVFKDVNCTIDGFQFDFGTGGIHGSIESSTVEADDDYVLVDWDVASYYPNLAIANGLYPQHLSSMFCKIYKDVYEQRQGYDKGTPENAMLKLALNATYGNSNNKYSPFYDPQYTMSITINGQLLLCMLAEHLMKIPGLSMVQINTDGLTVKCPKEYVVHMENLCAWWQRVTHLELENVRYSRMFIRDVNNYLAETVDGKVKRKGAYCYGDDLDWNQNFSSPIVSMAAEAALVHGTDIREFIELHPNVMDFMLRTKVPRSSKLAVTIEGEEHFVPNIVRYAITTDGYPLTKIMPPAGEEGEYKRASKLTDHFFNEIFEMVGLGAWDERIHTKNKSKYETRRMSINTGWLVSICNNIQSANNLNINYDWYVQEAEKLVLPLRGEG